MRLLKTAPSLQVLDAATLAIQELLKHYSKLAGLEALQQQQKTAATTGGGSAVASREASAPAGEGNLLFNALAEEVQVRGSVACGLFCLACGALFLLAPAPP